VTFESALSIAASRPSDQAALEALAAKAMEEGEEEQALPFLDRAGREAPTARLWQWKALLERSLDEHSAALASFEQAARLAPADASIAHGHARVAMEAGLDARGLYERALSLAPLDGEVIVGLAAARAAMGEGERSAAELRAMLERAPAWTYGHEQLAQLLATLGRASEATDSLEDALARFPKAVELWEALLRLQLRRGAYGTLSKILDRASAAGVRPPQFAVYRAIHAAEFDPETFPDALFGPASRAFDQALARWRIRHLLRAGAIDAVLPIIDRELQRDSAADLWAYAATAWRLAGDPRSNWLEGEERLVRVVDLTQAMPPLDEIAETLRSLHLARGEYLDQSVRGGTQTDGPLFCRIDPVIRGVRQAAVAAVEDYVARLPAPDPKHPLLGRARGRRVRFGGSWSVRLRGGGRHANHVHPQGWISSALYIALPTRTEREPDDSGWFTLGQPDSELGMDVAPWRKIEPRPGRLVLFPSWIWHGTVPFAQGERLTVAFDVAPPV